MRQIRECLTIEEVDAALEELVGTFTDPENRKDRVALMIPRTLYDGIKAIALSRHEPVISVAVALLANGARDYIRRSCIQEFQRASGATSGQ